MSQRQRDVREDVGVHLFSRLTVGDYEPGYYEVPDADRRYIAETWLTHVNLSGGCS